MPGICSLTHSVPDLSGCFGVNLVVVTSVNEGTMKMKGTHNKILNQQKATEEVGEKEKGRGEAIIDKPNGGQESSRTHSFKSMTMYCRQAQHPRELDRDEERTKQAHAGENNTVVNKNERKPTTHLRDTSMQTKSTPSIYIYMQHAYFNNLFLFQRSSIISCLPHLVVVCTRIETTDDFHPVLGSAGQRTSHTHSLPRLGWRGKERKCEKEIG